MIFRRFVFAFGALLATTLGLWLFFEGINHSTRPYEPREFTKADRIERAFEQEFYKTHDPRTLTVPKERLKDGIAFIKNYQKQAAKFRKAVTLNWEERGPYNVGGRTKALLWDPNDINNTKVWAGAASGGLWYNNDVTDVSSDWVSVDDQMASLSVTAIVYDPVNTSTMYLGTGEGHIIGSVRGAGMYKSTDGGVTWNHMTPANGFYDTESNFHYVNDILVVNEGGASGVVYVATQASLNEYTYYGYGLSGQNGLWRSTDGGATFTEVIGNIPGETYKYPMGDLELDANGRIWAGSARDIYGGATATIFYSDNGTTWNVAHNPGTGDRVELATAPSDANRVYAVAANGGSVAWMVTTSTATTTPTSWSSITIPTHYDPASFGGACGVICNASGDFTRSSQAFYDLILKVDPTNASKVWVGGIDLHQSTNAGSTWSQMTSWYEDGGLTCSCLPSIHADQHVLEFNPADNTQLLAGHDGGVSLSNDANATEPAWITNNSGYNVTQFYGGAIHPTASTNQFLAGAQDNGSQYFSGTGMITTSEATGGDGAFCHIDQDEPQYQWTQYVYNSYYRSSNSGVSFGNQISFGSSAGRFINPSAYDDSQNIMYAAGNANQFLRWTNPQTGSTGSFVTANFGGHVVSSLAVSPNIANRVYFGTGNNGISETGSGKLYYVDGANAGTSETPTEISGASFPANSYLSSIAIETGNENHIVVTFSNYGVASVWETTDGGTNWTNIEGNLPDMPVRWAVIHPEDANRVILATELGVWSTDDTDGSTTEWTPHDDEDFPHVRTDMLKVRTSDLEMIALTHGRGLWSTNITLPTTTDPEISFVSASNTQTETTNATVGCRGYRDYTVQMEIANPPTGDAIATLAIDGASTASEGYDFDFTTTDFVTPSSELTFPDGSGLSRSFTVRIYDDEALESSESIVFTYSIGGTTNAIAAAANQIFTFTINDNEATPVTVVPTELLNETWTSPSGWFVNQATSGARNNWAIASGCGVDITGVTGQLIRYTAGGAANCGYRTLNSQSYLYKEVDASAAENLVLEFDYRVGGNVNNYGNVVYSTDGGTNWTVVGSNYTGSGTLASASVNLPALLNNTTFMIGFLWTATSESPAVNNATSFGVDNIVITGDGPGTQVASTAAQGHQAYLGPYETVYFYDDVSGDILLSIENLSDWDYGCTSVSIASGGTGAMSITNTTTQFFPADKTIDISPENNNPSGSYTITLYYSEAEINGWLAATVDGVDSNTLGDLELIKVSGSLNANVLANDVDWESTSPTIANFGSEYTLSATFNTGFSSFGLGNTAGWGVLPVDLISFKAKAELRDVLLQWETASEKNADYFDVEFSLDGINFETLGTIKAHGDSKVLVKYTYRHEMAPAGIKYYRLKQVDFDRQFEYSDIRLVDGGLAFDTTIKIYPNPTSDYVSVESTGRGKKKISILSLSGKLIYTKETVEQTTQISVSELTKGVYFVKIEQGGQSTIKKLLVK